MKRNARRVLVLATLLASACGDGLVQMTSVDRQSTLVGETITIDQGDNQAGGSGLELPNTVRFVVKNSLGNPIGAAQGTIAVSAGGGSVNKATYTADPAGIVKFKWTLGTTGTQTVLITLNGSATTAVATARVIPAGSTLVLVGGNNQTAVPGDTLPASVRVKLLDPSNVPIEGARVLWTVEAGTGGGLRDAAKKTAATGMSPNFWVLGWGKPTQTLTATVAGVVGSVVFTATTATAGYTLTVFSGNNQTAAAGVPLPNNIVAVLRDASNVVVPNAKGTFQVTQGGGSATTVNFTTNSNGRAITSWVLGPTGTQKLRAKIGAVGNLDFTATISAPSNFNIDVVYIVPATAGQQAAVNAAVARWRQVITGDLADFNFVNFTVGATCVASQPVINRILDDVIIFIDFGPIDGVNGTLGSAGPCNIRGEDFLPLIGAMKLDQADLANMEANGSLTDVILHEMGHILGIGTLWGFAHGALPARLTGINTPDVHYAGPLAQTAFTNSGGGSFVGSRVPVENCVGIEGCGAGTINGHWRELVMGHELMTGYLSGAVRALSLITVQSLADIGYTVNTGAANAYTVSPSLRFGLEPVPIKLNELPPPPIYAVDEVTGAARRIR